MPWGINGGGGGSVGSGSYLGTYDASTNTPTLTNGTGQAGQYLLVVVAGSNNPTGQNIDINHIIIYNGSIWQDGGTAYTTDDFAVSANYVPSSGQKVEIGQNMTQALNALQGQLDTIDAQLNPALVVYGASDLLQYSVAYQLPGTNTVGYAQANAEPQAFALGLVQNTTLSGNVANLQTLGVMYNPSWTWTQTGNIYLSPITPGGLTQSPPIGGQYNVVIGTALTPTSINIDITYNGLI